MNAFAHRVRKLHLSANRDRQIGHSPLMPRRVRVAALQSRRNGLDSAFEADLQLARGFLARGARAQHAHAEGQIARELQQQRRLVLVEGLVAGSDNIERTERRLGVETQRQRQRRPGASDRKRILPARPLDRIRLRIAHQLRRA
jgi:hypothetical protein